MEERGLSFFFLLRCLLSAFTQQKKQSCIGRDQRVECSRASSILLSLALSFSRVLLRWIYSFQYPFLVTKFGELLLLSFFSFYFDGKGLHACSFQGRVQQPRGMYVFVAAQVLIQAQKRGEKERRKRSEDFLNLSAFVVKRLI